MKEVIIWTTEEDVVKGLTRFLAEHSAKNPKANFEEERLNRTQAERLADMCSPTFRKMVLSGIFPEHGFNRKKFYLKSEILSGLKKNADHKIL